MDVETQQCEDLYVEYLGALGARPSWSRPLRRIDWALSAKVIRRAIGHRRTLSPRYALFRCRGCSRLLTNVNLCEKSGCRCGSREYSSSVGDVGLTQVALALMRGD